MSWEIYKKLAEKLDNLPNRFQATESGVEIRLLVKIFSLDEAVLAAEMFEQKEPAAVIAARANVPENEARHTLKDMVRKKLILFSKGENGLIYGLMPFVVGFYEESLPRMDEELAELFEAYFQETRGGITGDGLSVHRVIPVQESIDFEMEVFPYEKASDLIENAKAWGVRDCICRVQKQLIGDPCEHPIENCLSFAPVEGYFNNSDVSRALTKEEALQILKDAEDAGLVHTTGNYKDHINYICNCCTCSCGILRGVAEFNNSAGIAKSDFLAVVDEDLCIACGDCLERCQFVALDIDGAVCRVDINNCVGCGLCMPVCPEDALILIRRPEGEVMPPPDNIVSWGKIRSEN
ncbi:MAG: 4Fe-4S binding protein [Anaerolineales bacterium]|nr:4Fe-4S binding protein [Anaerolineales bacterium]